MFTQRTSLKKKLILLAVLPAIAGSLLSALLVSNSARRASALVRTGLADFMIARTERSLFHGYSFSMTVLEALRKELQADMRLADALLSTRGVSLAGAPVPHYVASDPEHIGGQVALPAMRIGKESIVSGRSEFVQEVAHDTGALVVLFERVSGTGELVRVSSNLPSVRLDTFLAGGVAGSTATPEAELIGGRSFTGRTLEAGGWHYGTYEPLRGVGGQVIGALYIGVPTSGMTPIRDELAGNNIGKGGSVAILYAHGPQRGTFLEEPTGIAAETESQWLPVVLASTGTIRSGEQRAVDVRSPVEHAEAIVRFGYIQPLDWLLVTVADSRDLNSTGQGVGDEFRNLMTFSLLGYLLLLGGVVWVALVVSRKIVAPLQEVTIQLSANGTQVASSANQQMAYATNFNVSSTEIATAVKEISATSQELVRTMEELSAEATQVSTTTQEGLSGLRGLSNSNGMLMGAAQAIEESFNEIRTRANKINAVTLAVTRVADQTNLLSLNAAIEAEKAGEAGAGFAVVAREIRRLADQSAKASQEIEGTIQEIQTAMAAGLNEVRGLTSAVEQRVAFAERMLPIFERIMARVEAMPARYEMVHVGMQNQSEGAKQISEAMWQLTESAGQTAEATSELNEVSLALHRAVNTLKRRMFEGEDEMPAETFAGAPGPHAGRNGDRA